MSQSTPPTSTVTYEGHLRTRACHERSGAELITDAPVDNQGNGEAFSPTDLVATALASCALTIMGITARDRGLDLTGAHAQVVKEMDGPPRRISAIRIVLTLPAKGYDEAARRVLAKAAASCPVGRSLHPDLEQELTLVWLDDANA